MALQYNFYEEILDNEKTWIINLEYNLLNVYYLPELKNFYDKKIQKLNKEYELTQNKLIKSIYSCLKNIVDKIDEFIEQNEKGNSVNLNELKNLFFINVLNNNFVQDKIDIPVKEDNVKSIYELRNKINSEELDDDFYYSN